jgi:hypothetical protein
MVEVRQDGELGVDLATGKGAGCDLHDEIRGAEIDDGVVRVIDDRRGCRADAVPGGDATSRLHRQHPTGHRLHLGIIAARMDHSPPRHIVARRVPSGPAYCRCSRDCVVTYDLRAGCVFARSASAIVVL